MNNQSIQSRAEILDRIPRNAFFNLVPRYTCGSPAMVDLGEACRVADHERDAYENNRTGVFGEELKAKAEAKGLHGIAYARWEKGGKVWRLDLLTGKEEIELPRLSWDEKERVKDLRNRKQFLGLNTSHTTELSALEKRLEIHRETV